MDWVTEHWSEIAFVLATAYGIYKKVQERGLWQTILYVTKGIEAGDGSHGPVKTMLKNGMPKVKAAIAKNLEKAVDAVDPKKDTPFPLINLLLNLKRRK